MSARSDRNRASVLGVVLAAALAACSAPAPSAGGLHTLPVPLTTPSPSVAPSSAPSSAPSTPESASPAIGAVATRVVIPGLGIDLPVYEQDSGYPLCNVAMFIRELGQPGEGRATYLYAHARPGMFLAIYELAHAGRAREMLGLAVEVYTSDDLLHRYVVTDVRLHQMTMDDAIAATTEQLWLQTSEGVGATVGKTQVIAMPSSVEPAGHLDAHPVASPVVCG